ncbi:MAG: hypothetical protein WCJ09_22430, partial [Planctomycetota bacterium]
CPRTPVTHVPSLYSFKPGAEGPRNLKPTFGKVYDGTEQEGNVGSSCVRGRKAIARVSRL